MSIAIKPGYVNPLTTMGQKKNGLTATSPLTQQKEEKSENVQDLQTRQQALQNHILLLKSTSDGAAGTAESQEVLQDKLEEISTELKTAKTQEAQAIEPQSIKENFDKYDMSSKQIESPGLYQVQKDKENNYTILFSPFEEQQ